MRTKIDALYDLAKKMNGTAEKQDSIVEMIDQVRNGVEPSKPGKNIVELEIDLETISEEEVELGENDVATLNKMVEDILQDNNKLPDVFYCKSINSYYYTKYFTHNDGDYEVQIWSGSNGYWDLYEDSDKWYGVYYMFMT